MKGNKMRTAVFSSIKRMYLLYAFFIGLVLGTLFLNLIASEYYDEIGIFGKYFIDKFNSLDLNKSELFIYTFISRIKEMSLLFLFSFTIVCAAYNTLYCTFLGFSTGIFISSLTVNSGIKGVWFYLLSIFPHYILYVLMILYTLNKSYQINGYIYHKNTEFSRSQFSSNKNLVINIILILIIIIIFCLLESFTEVYVNTPILRKMLKTF